MNGPHILTYTGRYTDLEKNFNHGVTQSFTELLNWENPYNALVDRIYIMISN